jgi:type VI secretion system FHA domain protein
MIVLRVLSYNGAPADGPQARFDELGGTIGRAENNQLVLPDPERTISRVHARVVFRGGGYAVVDNGGNPISVNGRAVGAGSEQPLEPGDRLEIEGYVIAASAPDSADSSDPFAALFGDAPLGLAAPAAPAAPGPTRAPAMAAQPARHPTAAANSAAWPPAPQAPAPAAWPAAPQPAPRAAALSPGHIPDDWDPFAPDLASPAASAPAPQFPMSPADNAFVDLPASGSSLDDLFGLTGAPVGGDPLGAAPGQALAQPNTAQHADAYQSLSSAATPTAASHGDRASELNTPMPRVAQPLRPSPPTPAPLPQGAILSWNDPPRDGRVVTLPGVSRAVPAAPPTPSAPPAAHCSAPASARHEAARPAAADAELLQALLAGLDTPSLRLEALTPELMQLLGQLLRESMRGTVELLIARAALKREMRAEVTMIATRANNPLKFSPTVEVVLQHLLGPPASGFMPAAAAVRDAFDDLRAHQLGVMAGMRAALDGVLQRFDPAQLEGKLARRSAIDSLIPSTRKARLWEAFNQLFAQLQTEAQDDFDELFGKAFLKAYEDQLGRLQREPGPR